jgi:hypothetical protein
MKGSEFLFGTLGAMGIYTLIAKSRGEVLVGGDPQYFIAVLVSLVLMGIAIDILRDMESAETRDSGTSPAEKR